MPDQISPIEKGPVEADLERVSGEINRLKEMPEHRERPTRELVKIAVAPVAQPQTDSNNSLPQYMADASASAKSEVENLLSMAFDKGIDAAFETAKSSSPFIMDAFHDAVTGSFYDELKKRGLLD